MSAAAICQAHGHDSPRSPIQLRVASSSVLQPLVLASTNPQPAVTHSARPILALPLSGSLTRFASRLGAAAARPDVDPHRAARRRAVMALVRGVMAGPQLNSVQAFERVLNGALDLGYRAEPLLAFVFDALQRRLAARIRRRLSCAGRSPDSAEVADLVSAAFEAIGGLLRLPPREHHTLRYAMLVAIADHRAIDYLRRRRPIYRETMDDRIAEEADAPWDVVIADNPERRIFRRERQKQAEALQEAVLSSVETLPPLERAALIRIEIDGWGYPEVAAALGIKGTDVGNLVRRARLLRDRALVPRLRANPELAGHLGFSDLQENRELRTNMLSWAAEIGEGLCPGCQTRGHLHPLGRDCLAGHSADAQL